MSNYCMRCGKPSDDSTAPCLCHLLNKESNALVNPHFCEPRGCPTPGACSAAARIAELEAALADAIKRAEAAEKDAERYRWIRDQCTWGDIYIAIGRDGLMTPGHIICGAADRAIDAAIAKEGGR